MDKDASDMNVSKRRGGQPHFKRINENVNESVLVDNAPKTPPRNNKVEKELSSTPISSVKLLEQTPRRSCRKSIKPVQEYNEIVCSRNLRSTNKVPLDEESNEENITTTNINKPKWTPAKVGRVSQKRSARKSSRKTKTKKSSDTSDEENNINKTPDEENNINKTPDEDVVAKSENNNILNTTFDQDVENLKVEEENKIILTTTFDHSAEANLKVEEDKKILNTTFDHSAEANLKVEEDKKILNTTFDHIVDTTEAASENKEILNTTFEKIEETTPQILAVEKVVNKISSQRVTGEPKGEEREISIKTGPLDLDEMGVTPISYDNEESSVVDDVAVELPQQIENSKIVGNEQKEKTKKLAESPLQDDAKVAQQIKINNEKEIQPYMGNESAEIDESSLDCMPITADDDHDEVFILNEIGTETKVSAVHSEPMKVEEFKEEEEMPSLIFCDEDDDETDCPNDTFNESDCMIISPSEASVPKKDSSEYNTEQKSTPTLGEAVKKVKRLQRNYFSPVKSLIKFPPKVVLTAEDGLTNETLVKSQFKFTKRNVVNTPNSAKAKPKGITSSTLLSTPIKGTEPNIRKTPTSVKAKPSSKGYRFPTPFKGKRDFKFGKKDNESDAASSPSSSNILSTITLLEPREIVLRSIRKRSMSVTIEGDARKRKGQNVTFYSPANQTATIADMDEQIAKSALKKRALTNIRDNPPRKRSLSMDERLLRHPSKLPRPVLNHTKVNLTPQKPTTSSRVKVPNFAAIHQKQFQKMENLTEYVQRKAERAQNLTNSALKARNAPPKLPLEKTNKPAAAKVLPLAIATDKENFSKLTERKNRHMEMFKSRSAEPKRVTRKNSEIIRGVRSNRRFELMMQHRKTGGN